MSSDINYVFDKSSGLERILYDDQDREVVYFTSNESIKPAEDTFSRISGLGRYVGVVGGFTASLYILSKLQDKNNLSSVDMVDISPSAIWQALEIINKFNNSSSEEYKEYLTFEYSGYLSHAALSCSKDDETYNGFAETNLKKPNLTRDLNLRFSHAEVFDFLGRLENKGKYFIYLSNLLDYAKWSAGSELIRAKIVDNDNIENGSYLLLTSLLKARRDNLNSLIEDKSNAVKADSTYAFGIFKKENSHLSTEFVYSLI
ncbi:hypothetical protein IHE51_00390 [Candidatus Parvarchaeota archaeon]|uniref:Uncharacterized protein n=1 Tax=Candidatus Acidifodinimicrobium mancum TaxID=2898728 RepID=A0A8T3UUQ0_9ARCH|nr:hypothetical protein [Candidatus Acidifodinimicrobium mancum]MBE5728306.1 hypothetical protein [Candidatus Acidifodinimicrobium mancum]MBE5728925.1 hypothetical protein [Candidatus Acidifodinimicrobium mancum]MBE5729902.1 hypothetical protein [Candidatus Acidifodinimicrobium mancum]